MEIVKTSGIGGHWHLHKVSCKKWFVRIRIVFPFGCAIGMPCAFRTVRVVSVYGFVMFC